MEIPVTYKNKELTFKANVVRFGYIHHVIVDLNGTQVTIERDEEGEYRALVYGDNSIENNIDKGLIDAVVNVLQAL